MAGEFGAGRVIAASSNFLSFSNQQVGRDPLRAFGMT